jgi:hypothetical protein
MQLLKPHAKSIIFSFEALKSTLVGSKTTPIDVSLRPSWPNTFHPQV